ncbi:hypothetical protein OBJ95_06605 [Empedobacter falsenii]
MKKIASIFLLILLFGCNNSKDKELQLKEKELELKERQFKLDSIKTLSNFEIVESKSIDSVIVKEEPIRVKESTGVEIKKIKFPKGQLTSNYTFEFRCDNEAWGKCVLYIRNKNKIVQKYSITNSAGLIKNIQLIDNKFFYFYSEIYGGTAGNYSYYHYLIDLSNSQVYRKEMECVEGDHKECQLKQPLSIKFPAFRYYEESEDL